MTLDGLDIDNNFTWTIVQSLTSVNEMTNEDVDAQLAKKDTTENREFAYALALRWPRLRPRNGPGTSAAQRRTDQLPA